MPETDLAAEGSAAGCGQHVVETELADAPQELPDVEVDAEDASTQRRRLAAVWLGAGSAVAAMVGVNWHLVTVDWSSLNTDVVGHAAAAQWLQTLPWWDWRGWSDWFYGGQAIGVNYPPLGHAWMRFTHPVHGQMAAVAIGLLMLLPWGALRLARAVGYRPPAQRAAVAAVLVLTAASANMHWVLSGFHSERTLFASWPAMLATVIGLHAAAWAARCCRPLGCGLLAGAAVLFNATVVPGIAVVCAVLLATSGASFRQAFRWAATASAAAIAVCAWWLVPFLAGWERIVRWEVPLRDTWNFGGTWQNAVLALLGVAAAWAAVRPGPARRLALAAGAGLMATVFADLGGYLRPERWLESPILVAAVAAAGLLAASADIRPAQPVRPAWAVIVSAALIVVVVVTLRLELIPLSVWLMRGSRRAWSWGSALAWAAVLALVPLWGTIRSSASTEPPRASPLEAAASLAGPDDEGLVGVDIYSVTPAGESRSCGWGHPWGTTRKTGGRVRPLLGLYQESSKTAEFLLAEVLLRGLLAGTDARPHWLEAWDMAERPSMDGPARAEALGARWYVVCDDDGNPTATALPGVLATGVSTDRHSAENSWHRTAVSWWISIESGLERAFSETPQAKTIPVLWPTPSGSHPPRQAADGVTMVAGGDSLIVTAEVPGWVWLRVPWDPHWRSLTGSPVLKGGPGHLVIWAEEGDTELRWRVPGAMDAAAVAVTGAALVGAGALAAVNRRRGWAAPVGRRRAAEAVEVFAATVDDWTRAVCRALRRLAHP